MSCTTHDILYASLDRYLKLVPSSTIGYYKQTVQNRALHRRYALFTVIGIIYKLIIYLASAKS